MALAIANDSVNDLNSHDLCPVEWQPPEFVESIACDQVWIFMLHSAENLTPVRERLLSYFFSIPCSNSDVASQSSVR